MSLATVACVHTADTMPVDFVVYDQRFHDFVAPGAVVEVVAGDFGWAEGPVWAAGLDALLFSDVAANTVYRWDEAGGLQEFLTPSGHAPDEAPLAWRGSNGLAIDAEGRLLLAQHGGRALARMRAPLSDPKPDYQILAGDYDGKSLNSPNDLAVHRAGAVFLTDPPYGLDGAEKSPDVELGFFGVFRLDTDGNLSLVTKALEKPNGIALSPDYSTLYVSNSEPGDEHIIAIELDSDGNPGTPRMFFDARALTSDGPGATDGLAVHPSGHIFATVSNGVAILSPGGKLLGKIPVGQTTNVALDARSSHFYITTPDRLLRIEIEQAE